MNQHVNARLTQMAQARDLVSRETVVRIVAITVAIPFAYLAGRATVHSPQLIVPLLAGAGAVTLLAFDRWVSHLFILGLGLALLGYAFFDRGFAYLGVPPLFVGELVLALGAFTIVVGAKQRVRLNVAYVLLGLFMAWGAIRTVPAYSVHGLDALRDSVIWGYAVFGIALSLVLTRTHVTGVVRTYSRFIAPALIWVPIAVVVSTSFEDSLPRWPISGGPLLSYKGGDMAVHLAGIAAYILIGLRATAAKRTRLSEWHIWILWSIGLAVCVTGRSALLTVLCALAGAVFLSRLMPRAPAVGLAGDDSRLPRRTRRGHVFPMLAVIGFVGTLSVVFSPSIQIGSRSVSVEQAVDNLKSIYGTDDPENIQLQQTRNWRTRWWGQIVDYTIQGQYFWTGKGFGPNLATEDGFQVRDGSLRSPHSIHFNILARMGVPGLTFWIALQIAFAAGLLRAFLLARARRELFWAQLDAWILVYWGAFMVNASFDVYLEGPQGGIWFWSLFGFGLAAIRLQRDSRHATPHLPAAAAGG